MGWSAPCPGTGSIHDAIHTLASVLVLVVFVVILVFLELVTRDRSFVGHEHARAEVERRHGEHEDPPQAASEHALVHRDGEELTLVVVLACPRPLTTLTRLGPTTRARLPTAVLIPFTAPSAARSGVELLTTTMRSELFSVTSVTMDSRALTAIVTTQPRVSAYLPSASGVSEASSTRRSSGSKSHTGIQPAVRSTYARFRPSASRKRVRMSSCAAIVHRPLTASAPPMAEVWG